MGVVKYTGPVASFHCPTNADIRSLKVHFSPKQEGTGNPSPENVRPIVGWEGVEVQQSGKNLFDTYNVVHVTPDAWCNSNNHKIIGSNGDKTLYISCLANTTYTISKNIGDVLAGGYTTELPAHNVDLYSYYRDTSARKITITTGGDAKYIAIWYYDKSKTHDKTMTPEDIAKTIQIQYGPNADNYEFYQGSTTDYEFGTLGKNKLPIVADMEVKSINTNYDNTLQRDMTPGILYPNVSANNYWLGTSAKTFVQEVQNGSITFQGSSSAYGIGTIVSVQPQVTYTISYTTSDNQVRIRIGYYDADGYFTGTHRIVNSGASFTIPNDVYHMIIVATPNTDYSNQLITVSNLQLELGSTATEYEPYDPNHTVYGGWVDLISGEVCEEYGLLEIDNTCEIYAPNSANEPWNHRWSIRKWNSNTNKWFFKNNTNILYCDRLNKVSSATKNGEIYGVTVESRIYLYDNEITTVEEFHTKYDGMELCAPINEPYNTYSLAPTQLQTFLGQNNVWSNADYIEVEYDLHETQDILTRKQFIMANQPHIETLAPAPLQSFNTDMVAPLKECKVYFEPIQAGTGNPSFDNVRTISGWSKLLIGLNSKNLANPNDTEYGNYTISPTGEYTSDSNRRISSGFISCSEKMPISMSANRSMSFSGIAAFDKNKNYLGRYAANGGSVRNYITPSNTQYIRFFTQDYNTPEAFTTIQLQVELNENPTEYEPYKGQTFEIILPDTFYGGYVDLTRGVLIETQQIFASTWGELILRGSYADETMTIKRFVLDTSVYPTGNSYDKSFSNIVPRIWKWTECIDPHYYVGDSKTIWVFLPSDTNNDTLVQIVCNLVEPVIHQLEPVTIKTLKGQNNIWSNSNGPIDIKYWTH